MEPKSYTEGDAMKTAEEIRSRTEATNGQFMAAFKRGDSAALASLYTAQGQLLPANSDFVRGTEAIRGFWQGALDMGVKQVTLETVEVEAHGDTAIEVGRYKLLVGNGSIADAGKYIVIWKNERDAWKLHRDIWTTSQSSKPS
jgi:uncharacterized protein (TIGR02246 family)